jgi:hypothetical protein
MGVRALCRRECKSQRRSRDRGCAAAARGFHARQVPRSGACPAKSATNSSTPSTMTTIPARLAQVARTSANMTEASARARAHYREWYRAVRSSALSPAPALLRSPPVARLALSLAYPSFSHRLRTSSIFTR